MQKIHPQNEIILNEHFQQLYSHVHLARHVQELSKGEDDLKSFKLEE